MWYAAGNTSSYEMAARNGLGVLGFSVGSIDELAPVLEAYKREIANAEPIGEYVNDNVMVTSAAFVAEDREAAVKAMVGGRLIVPAEQRVPLPRHLPAPRLGPAVAGAAPRPDRRRSAGLARHPGQRGAAIPTTR